MIFQIALKNLFLHSQRHVLTSLGLCAGLLGVLLFGGYVLRMEDYLSTHAIYLKNAGHLTITKAGALEKYHQNPSGFALSEEKQKQINGLLASIKKELELERVIASASTQAMLTNGCQSFPTLIQGLLPEDQVWLTQHPLVLKDIPELAKMTMGIDFAESDSALAANISPTLWSFFNKIDFSQAKSLEGQTPTEDCDLTSPDFQVYTQDFWGGLGLIDTSIVGLKYSGFSFNDEVFLQMKMSQFQNLVKSEAVYKLSLFFADGKNLKSKLKRTEKVFKENGMSDLEIHPFNSIKISPIYIGSMNFIIILLIFFVVLICGVVALTIANSIQIAFIERKKDIAVYKSIGFRNNVIIKIFQWEYFLLSLVSALFTLVVSLLVVNYVNSLNIRFQLPGYSSTLQFLLNPSISYIISCIFLILIMVQLTTRWQLYRLLKKPSIELMRFDS